jgi:hypothetical protein
LNEDIRGWQSVVIGNTGNNYHEHAHLPVLKHSTDLLDLLRDDDPFPRVQAVVVDDVGDIEEPITQIGLSAPSVDDNGDSVLTPNAMAARFGGGATVVGATGNNGENSGALSQSPRAIVERYFKKVHKALTDELVASGMKAHAALLRSQTFERSGRWLAGQRGIFYGRFGLNGCADFKEAVGLRLLVPPVPDLTAVHRLCTCEYVCCSTEDDFHLFTCAHSAWYTIQRHKDVISLLKGLIQKCDPDADVRTEFALQTTKGPTQTVWCDIYVASGRFAGQVIDVTIREPTAQKYLREGSWEKPGVAIAMGETEKKRLYGRVGDIVENGMFVAFALETTGRMGKTAMDFAETVTAGKHDLLNRFIDQVNVVLVHYGGLLVATRRGQLRAPRQGNHNASN